MILRYLELGRNWGKDPAKSGKAVFANDDGEVSINLTDKHVHAILEVCADAIIDTAKQASRAIVSSTVDAVANKPIGEITND